jgi:protein SCO1
MPMKPDRVAIRIGAALAAAGCATAAGCIIWKLTAGMLLFTSESWRRAAVEAAPTPVPIVDLQDDAGDTLRLDRLCSGRVLVVDFIYTQCPTICKSLGATSSQLARRLASTAGLEDVVVVSVSFDPENDTPDRLRTYKRAMESAPTAWRLARPVTMEGRERLLDAFGVVVIPDGMGGYDHNAALHVVDQQCRLARILGADSIDAAETAVRQLAGRKGT